MFFYEKKSLKTLITGIITCTIPIALIPINTNASTITPTSPENKGTTPIEATVTDNYTVTIPDKFDFGNISRGTGLTYTSAGSISATDITIGDAKNT